MVFDVVELTPEVAVQQTIESIEASVAGNVNDLLVDRMLVELSRYFARRRISVRTGTMWVGVESACPGVSVLIDAKTEEEAKVYVQPLRRLIQRFFRRHPLYRFRRFDRLVVEPDEIRIFFQVRLRNPELTKGVLPVEELRRLLLTERRPFVLHFGNHVIETEALPQRITLEVRVPLVNVVLSTTWRPVPSVFYTDRPVRVIHDEHGELVLKPLRKDRIYEVFVRSLDTLDTPFRNTLILRRLSRSCSFSLRMSVEVRCRRKWR